MDHSSTVSENYPEEEPSSPTAMTSLLVPGDSTEAAFEAPSIELPVGLPLSHQVFRDPAFDPDQFLLSRRHTALEDLRTELRSYLAGLKSELVGLINEDYEDFIGLGMGLRGTVERAIGKMKAPIGQAKQDVLEAKTELEIERADLEGLLNERRKVIEGKKLVRLMLDCGDSVTKVEEILSIQQPQLLANQTTLSRETSTSLSPIHRVGSKHRKNKLSLDLTDDCSDIESGVKRTERITNEYTRMLYLVSKGADLNYVNSLQPRITHITDALHRELASLLKAILRTPRSDTRRKDCLLECLRAYESLGAITRAEEVIKTEVVLPRMSKLIHPNVLDTGALSPLLPASPEVARFNPSRPPLNPKPSLNSLRLPEDPELMPLPMLYNKILAFIARDMGAIIDIADRQLAGSKQTLEGQPGSVQDIPTSPKEINGEKPPVPSHYNVLVNSVILPTLQLITNSLGSRLFAAGNPGTFHRNYSYTIKFLEQLEEFCSTPRQVLILRAHSEWKAFKNKWQLAVYAQIRTKEIILAIEDGLLDGLKAPDPTPIITASNGHDSNCKPVYLLKGSATIDHVLHSIWQDDVFLTDLTHRFWRLTLMSISRYATWLNSVTGAYLNHSTTGAEHRKGNEPKSRMSTDMNRLAAPSTNRTSYTRLNSPSKNMSEESEDEELLRILTVVLADLLRLRLSILSLFSNLIAPRIPKVSIGPDSQTPEEVLKVSLNKIVGMEPQLTTEIRSTLVKRCSEKLRFIRSVGSSARASKTIPTEPSYFISDILNDIKVYLEKYGKHLAEQVRTDLVSGIIDELSGKYLAILINVQRSEDSLRKLKKGKHGFSIFNRNSTPDSSKTDLVEDDELKVKVQLKLDVERLELDSIRLGADLSSSKSFLELKQTVDK
ncbi:hypothetical protein PCANC_21501 [Puccinia coronata f. sp. avenae]|uniref:Conserved oligomeric Golgi complex subunit 2 n=2 Tax=Puccinia coronata f. sp. avenae TaxID=200324 RepID=A0A2N5S893_9BASI|nr:hypothetical protein PCANC_21501 [Puccinia coronata f. sp. avenae]